jgi:hypothetical protein
LMSLKSKEAIRGGTKEELKTGQKKMQEGGMKANVKFPSVGGPTTEGPDDFGGGAEACKVGGSTGPHRRSCESFR